MMDTLTLFGLFAVTAMLISYAFEKRSHWFILGFAVSCLLGSVYGFLQGAWPFGFVEAVWSIVALRRWFAAKAFSELVGTEDCCARLTRRPSTRR